MADHSWPKPGSAGVLGSRLSRLDGPAKVTGAAKYPSDVKRPGQLYGMILTCPHAHARIRSIDTAAAEKLPGVAAVHVAQGAGAEIFWADDEIAFVAAETESQARDAVRAIAVDYEVLEHYVDERDPASAPETQAEEERVVGDPDAAMAAAAVRVRRRLGMPMINHSCLEPHGQTSEWSGDELTVWASTQAVSTLAGQLAEPLETSAAKVRVLTDYMGGGFGSKFGPDRWGVEGARLARVAGRPVKLFLERDAEMAVSGSRPSAWAEIEVGADENGKLLAWRSRSWGSGGMPGTGTPPLPYVFEIAASRHAHLSVPTNFAGSKAWRAPNHPQACFLTLSMLDDLAAELDLDPLELVRRNLDLVAAERRSTYEEELAIAAETIGWQARWRPRRDAKGIRRRGLGLSIHTWGGKGHNSRCQVTVQPDGTVTARLGTQDLGTGTRTVVAMVLAETFGLPVDAVRVEIGDNRLPLSGPSGGSTTVGGVSAATRRAAQLALDEVFAKVAPTLDAEAGALRAGDGRVWVDGDTGRALSWKQAAARIGVQPIEVIGRNPGPGALTDGGVGGVQMAEVEVDVETGVVEMVRMVAVQDVGLVVNEKLAESQVFGALIMGIGSALFEERIADPVTGRLLNPNMEFYRLAGIGDVGDFDVHLMRGSPYEDRGVIGLGEPPVISPVAAIGNAIANAIGVRVTEAPFTPERVLAAIGERA